MLRTTQPFALMLLLATSSTWALDQNCELTLKASDARIKQTSWHSITNMPSLKMEVIKANGQFYKKTNDEKWSIFPVNIDNTEKELLAQFRKGTAKISQCEIVGSDNIEGKAVTVINRVIELPGAPPTKGTLFIGKADGLPYKQTTDKISVIYRYQNIKAPL